MKDVSRVDHLSSVQTVTNVPIAAPDMPVGARLHNFWEKMGSPGGQTKGHSSPQGRLRPPLPDPAKSDKVTHHHSCYVNPLRYSVLNPVVFENNWRVPEKGIPVPRSLHPHL